MGRHDNRDDKRLALATPDLAADVHDTARFHFPEGLDTSGFVGWLASHRKTRLGTGVFVICGQNNTRGGIFDNGGCPALVGGEAIAEINRLRQQVGVPR